MCSLSDKPMLLSLFVKGIKQGHLAVKAQWLRYVLTALVRLTHATWL